MYTSKHVKQNKVQAVLTPTGNDDIHDVMYKLIHVSLCNSTRPVEHETVLKLPLLWHSVTPIHLWMSGVLFQEQ